ncbi:MAG: dicarboxylate/amino acid:cation symporter [Gemmatimonadaceae bacterium]
MSLTTRVLIGLVTGLGAGIAISMSQSPALLSAVKFVEPLGTIFINSIRMTVVPLVVASLITGVARSGDARAIGRIGWRALVIFLAVLFAGAVFGAIAGQPLLARLQIDPASIAALQAGAVATGQTAAESAAKLPTFAQWLVELVPTNPIKAAADGAMLPLIVFSLVTGVALLRIRREQRESVIGFLTGVFDAMLVLVRWVLAVAPIGVFALALSLATKLGVAAAGALAYFVVLVSALSLAFMVLVLYPAAVSIGRVPLREFARACAPPQAVAISSRSSLAALPAMMESSSSKLHLPPAITNFFLPLAASTFRAGSGVGLTVSVLFVARLYGVDLGVPQLATVILTVVLTSFSVPGIPGGSIIAMLPVLLAAGIPPEGIGILLGVDTIPDMFRTTTNVTGHMAAAVMLARGGGRDQHSDTTSVGNVSHV